MIEEIIYQWNVPGIYLQAHTYFQSCNFLGSPPWLPSMVQPTHISHVCPNVLPTPTPVLVWLVYQPNQVYTTDGWSIRLDVYIIKAEHKAYASLITQPLANEVHSTDRVPQLSQ